MTNKAITIIPIDDTDISIIQHIANSLEQAFQLPTAIKSWHTIFHNMPVSIYDREEARLATSVKEKEKVKMVILK